MATIENLPVELPPAETARRLRFNPGRAGFSCIEDLVDFALPLIDLKVVHDVAYLGSKGEGSIEVDAPGAARVVFESRILRRNLDQAQKIFPYIMTVGPDLERAAGSSGDLLRQYYLEELANIVLEDGLSRLSKRLQERWRLPGLSNMNPGSLEDWPIEEQGPLFSLLSGVESAIEVRLTDSFLMLPRKSISGIYFPSAVTFRSCQLCPREHCDSRKARYDATKAKAYGVLK